MVGKLIILINLFILIYNCYNKSNISVDDFKKLDNRNKIYAYVDNYRTMYWRFFGGEIVEDVKNKNETYQNILLIIENGKLKDYQLTALYILLFDFLRFHGMLIKDKQFLNLLECRIVSTDSLTAKLYLGRILVGNYYQNKRKKIWWTLDDFINKPETKDKYSYWELNYINELIKEKLENDKNCCKCLRDKLPIPY